MRASYILQEAWRSISRNRGAYVLAAAVQGICLVLLSIFIVLTTNVVQLSQAAGRRIELYVFLADDGYDRALEGRIGLIEGITSTRYVSKEEALAELRSDLGADGTLTDALGENPLPASIRVTISPDWASAARLGEIERKIALMPGVTEIWSGKEIVERLGRITRAVLVLDIGILVVVCFAVLFIVFQTVESSIVSRRHEIQIMELVGATAATVRVPFIVEGTSQGLLGGLAAVVIMFVLYRVVAAVIPVPGFPFGLVAAADLCLGALFGLAGSLIALNRIRGAQAPQHRHPPVTPR